MCGLRQNWLFCSAHEGPQVCKAFYGRCYAPRVWYDHVVSTFVSQGWTQLKSDPCCFVFFSEDKVHGVVGIHMDDFLLGGCDQDTVF